MSDRRLELALNQIGPGDWELFEKFAAEFMVVRFPNLRTTAAPQGDGGRDGELYIVGEDVTTALQYSVTADWSSKIRRTVKRLQETIPTVRELVYATNQVIGPAADELKAELWRDEKISLDVCDRNYFIDRQSGSQERIAASEELIALKVKPLLADYGIDVDGGSVQLQPSEQRLAVLHLSLDASDAVSEKGLTKSCFEALTRAALNGTTVDTPLAAAEIVSRVKESLPAGHDQQVSALVESALSRLSRKGGPINRLGKTDAYHVSFAEEQRQQEQASAFLLDEQALEEQLVVELEVQCGQEFHQDRVALGQSLRTALESILLRKGELFAQATATGAIEPIDAAEIMRAISSSSIPDVATPAQVAAATSAVLERPTDGVRGHLRRMADAYTLFAFLRQTPDVQKVVTKIFSDGDVWLDTSVVLPLLAETLIADPARRPFTVMLRAAQEAGLRLHATDGVIEEVERHLNRALSFANMDINRWHGRVPYVYAAYSDSGRPRNSFPGWVEEFRGPSRPEDDVREYLSHVFRIERRNLKEYSDNADTRVRATIQELWSRAHDRRRAAAADEWDQGTVYRLVEHDVENCVGVLELRKRNSGGGLGYRHWWLTLDKVAFNLDGALRAEFGRDAPMSPAMSPDYLVQTLRIGPMRTAVETDRRTNLPVLADFSRLDVTPRALIKSADEVRTSMEGASEHVIQRRVRDSLDSMRASYGTAVFEKSLVTIAGGEEVEAAALGLAERS